eukprot:Nitzschia sp. Nitz4//scaffold199_size41809//38612//39655//NITZ4_007459-RA/size41809-processed-gene-0.38-mRNA-1//-1//CDS//3329540588//3785//frame0
MSYLWSLFVILWIVSCIEGAEPGKTLLAIGDSMVAGVTGIDDLVSVVGFVDVLFSELQANYSFDTLANSACPAETTSKFLFPSGSDPSATECNVRGDASLCYSGFCDADKFPRGVEGDSQMEAVETYLADHSGEVGLIVLAIGADDLLACNTDNFITCVPSAYDAISTNLEEIMTRLFAAAPGVPVIGYVYHDPFMAYYLPNGDNSLATIYELLLTTGNDLLTGLYEQFGVYVVNGYTAINGYDQSGDPRQDVVNTCLYTGMCDMVDGVWNVGENPDYHPNEAGYKLVAMEYLNIVETNGLLTSSPRNATTSPTPSPTEGSASSKVFTLVASTMSWSFAIFGVLFSL